MSKRDFLQIPDLSAAEIDRLRSMLGGREVTVVLVTREPESFLRSYGAGIATAPEFADGHDPVLGDLSPTSWLVDYDAMVGVWSDAFGAENVVHASYEEEIRRHRSTVPRVLRECGLTFDQLPGGWREHRNVTADP